MKLRLRLNLSQLFYTISRICVYLYGLVFFLRTVIPFPERTDAILRLGIAAFGILGTISTGKVDFKRFVLSDYFIWYAGILAISLFSSLYSPSISTKEYTDNIVDVLFLGVGFSESINSEKNIHRFLLGFSICGLIMFGFLASHNLLHIDDRLGRTLTGDHTNSFAMYLMLTMFAAIAIAYLSEIKIEKLIGIGVAIVDAYMIMLSGGRKYILAPVIMVAIISIISTSGKKNIIKRIVIFAGVITLVVLGWNMMISNPLLYSTIGYRFVNRVSVENRELYIRQGLKFFFTSPIWGHGENAFSELIIPYVGRRAYSHNNYVELLTNFGIIGFGWFYYWFGQKLVYHIKTGKITKNRLHILSASLMIAMLFLDTGTISYCDSSLLFVFWALVFNVGTRFETINTEISVSARQK